MKRILALIFTLVMVLSCVAFMGLADGSTPTSFELIEGPTVRLDADDSGLRFKTRILTSELEALGEDVMIGTLILPTDLITVEGIKVDTEDVMHLSTETQGARLSVEGEYTVFYAAIVDILPQNYARDFSAVSYIKVGDSYSYTAASNPCSIYAAALAAWESGERSDIVKGYLDKVIDLNNALLVKAIDGYTSPYTVTCANDKLTVSKNEGAFTSEEEIATIIIDGKPYTDGWDLVDGKLTAAAPYTTHVYQNYNGDVSQTVTNVAGEANVGSDAGIRLIVAKRLDGNANVDSNACATLTAVDEGGNSLNYLKASWSGKDGVGGTFNILTAQGGLKAPFTTDGHTKLSISMSLMIPEDCQYAPLCKFALRATNRIENVFIMQQDKAIVLNGGNKAVAVLQKGVFTDITLVFDFATGKSYGYCNGEFVAQGTIPNAPGDDSLLEYMGAHSTKYIFEGRYFCNGLDASAGICIDNVVVRTY